MADEHGLTLCEACRFWQRGITEGLCRRHAPSATDRPQVVARWPETRAQDSCGEGRPQDDAAEASEAPLCSTCVFWQRPGIGIDPTQRGDLLPAWWSKAGYCRRHAPCPGNDIGQHAYWRATNGGDFCFEGKLRTAAPTA